MQSNYTLKQTEKSVLVTHSSCSLWSKGPVSKDVIVCVFWTANINACLKGIHEKKH